MRAAEEKYGDDLVVLFVDEEESVQDVNAFAARYGLESVFVMDTTGSVGVDYRLFSTPTTYIVDADGVIRNIQAGVINLAWLDSQMAALSQ